MSFAITIKRKNLNRLVAGVVALTVILVALLVYNRYVAGKAGVLGFATLPFIQPTVTPTATLTPTLTPTPTPVPYTITFISGTENFTEGGIATFTWDIGGPSAVIHTTAVYYGTKSLTEALTSRATPQDTPYTNATKDFLDGDFDIPLRFVANVESVLPGTYYYRVYALIEGKHYWTEEESFIVKQAERNNIQVVDYPTNLAPGKSGAFTWEITGPASTTEFTAIVASKESKSGSLNTTLTDTPYKVIVNEFTNGNSQVPLRFVGNATVSESGKYYFRSLAVINGKNVWSQEYTFTVQ